MEKEDLKELIKRVEILEDAVFKIKKVPPAKTEQFDPKELDFTLNERTFVSRYVSDKGGPKRFALLLAYVTKGEIGKEVNVNDIITIWSRMSKKDLLGPYNRFYPNEAKTKGWVDSKKTGMYQLTKEWTSTLIK